MLTLIRRLRWEPDAESGAAADSALMARTFAYLYGAGGSLALVTLLLPGAADRSDLVIAAIAFGAYAAAATCLVGFDRLPRWFFLTLPPVGAVLSSGVVLAGGAAVASVYAVFYFWVMLSAFSFFSLRAGLLNIAWVAIVYAATLALLGAPTPAVRWLMVIAGLTVAGLVISALRRRVESLVHALTRRASQQDAIARIGRRALSTIDLNELFEVTARTVAETLGVEHAAILGLPNGRSLMYRAGTGWDRFAVRSASVPLDDPLAGPALLASGPILYQSEEEPLAALGARSPNESSPGTYSGVAAAIRGPEDTLGVVAAYGSRPRGFNDSDARFIQSVANVLAEASRRAAVEEEARRQIVYDPVTGRPNRLLFMDRLGEAVLRANRAASTLAVYIVEIDEFKIINDSYGDLFGNALLRAFASRLREPLYLADTVARLEGPEFAVLCEDLDTERGAVQLADDLLAAIETPFDIAGERIRVTAHIGVARSDRSAAAKDLVARADAALYKSRERDLGGYEFFDEDLRARLAHRVSLGRALSEAPERGELWLATQPIVSLADGRVQSSECLLRWRHPERGAVEPLEFIPVAEETGAIIGLGTWVVGEAMRMAARARRELGEGASLPLHVNISPRQLAQADFLAGLRSALRESGARPGDIALEITEHALVRDEEAAARVLEGVHALGIAVVLDDFGSGYSSLRHLSRFPLVSVKIDRQFITRIEHEPADATIVAAVIKMGQALGLEVTAVGIETAEQRERLRGLGCDYGQGRLFGYPTSSPSLPASREETAARASSSSE